MNFPIDTTTTTATDFIHSHFLVYSLFILFIELELLKVVTFQLSFDGIVYFWEIVLYSHKFKRQKNSFAMVFFSVCFFFLSYLRKMGTATPYRSRWARKMFKTMSKMGFSPKFEPLLCNRLYVGWDVGRCTVWCSAYVIKILNYIECDARIYGQSKTQTIV